LVASARGDTDAGFSLSEVTVATALLALAIVSLAELVGIAVVANRHARDTTYATVLAFQKMEQLRGLTYASDTVGFPITDTTTDTAVVPAGAAGGTGLSASPAGTLDHNTAGFVDYLDEQGTSLGGGAGPPIGTVYIRRWSIEPVAGQDDRALVLQVLVTTLRNSHAMERGSGARMPGHARLVGVRTRRVPWVP
jgi:hypothetical protein